MSRNISEPFDSPRMSENVSSDPSGLTIIKENLLKRDTSEKIQLKAFQAAFGVALVLISSKLSNPFKQKSSYSCVPIHTSKVTC